MADSVLVARLKREFEESDQHPAFDPCGRLERTIGEQELAMQVLVGDRNRLIAQVKELEGAAV